MTHRLFSLLSTLTVLGSGCALLGNRPADVPWSPSLVKALPTPPLYCFSQTVVGPRTFETCLPDLSDCAFAQQRAAGTQGVLATTSCLQANEPYCFVYDTEGEGKLVCSSSKASCEADNQSHNRGLFTPVIASTCGPLAQVVSQPAAPPPSALTSDELRRFLGQLDLAQASAPVTGVSNGLALKPLTGALSRRADGTFFLRFSDLLAGGTSEFGIDLPALKVGQRLERLSGPEERCPTSEMQVYDPDPASGHAYRFNDAACSWSLEVTSLPKLPARNPRDEQDAVGVATGRLVLRLVQQPGLKPTRRIAPSWVMGTFSVPVRLAAAAP